MKYFTNPRSLLRFHSQIPLDALVRMSPTKEEMKPGDKKMTDYTENHRCNDCAIIAAWFVTASMIFALGLI